MRTLVVRTDHDFFALENAWTELLERSGQDSIFLTYDWAVTWWKHCGEKKRLFVIGVEEDGRLIGIAPLMIEKRFGLKTLKFLSNPIADYEDFIVDASYSRTAVLKSIIVTLVSNKTEWDVFKLRVLREDSPHFKSIQQISEEYQDQLYLKLALHSDGAPYIRIEGNFDQYQKSLKSKFMADTRRRASILQQQGNISFHSVAHADFKREVIAELMDLHKKRRASMNTRSIFEDAATRSFFYALADRFADRGWLSLTCMQLERGQVSLRIAAHFGFEYMGRFYYYIPGFSEEFSKCAAGRLLLIHLLKNAFEKKSQCFDFMLGEETYKFDFEPARAKLYSLTMLPSTIQASGHHLILEKLVHAASRVVKSF